MKIQTKASRMELTPAIREYVENKMNMLDKYLGNLEVMNCDVEVSLEGKQHSGDIFKCSINLQVPGDVLRIEKTESDLYKAIDKAKDHMEQIIIKYKEKHNI